MGFSVDWEAGCHGQHHIKIFQSLFLRACQANFFSRKEKAGTTHSYRIQTSSHHHYGIILMQKFGTESTGIQRDNIQKNGWEFDTFFSLYKSGREILILCGFALLIMFFFKLRFFIT